MLVRSLLNYRQITLSLNKLVKPFANEKDDMTSDFLTLSVWLIIHYAVENTIAMKLDERQ